MSPKDELRKPYALGLHHAAHRCRDAEETRAFYEDILGFRMVLALNIDNHVTTGVPLKYLHIFFDIGTFNTDDTQSNYLAFFDLADYPSEDPEGLFEEREGTDLHFAIRVPDHEALQQYLEKLEANGIKVDGPIQHGMCSSIYFYDPNGYRMEFCAENEMEHAEFAEHTRNAKQHLADWVDWKASRLLN